MSVGQSPPEETDSRLAAQEIRGLLRNPEAHYCVHKSPQLVPILSHLNSSTTSHTIYMRSILILSSITPSY